MNFGKIKFVIGWVILSVIVYLAASISNAVSIVSNFYPPVWLPTGLGLAVFLLWGVGKWPGFWVGLSLFYALNMPLTSAVFVAATETIAVSIAAFLIRRWVGAQLQLIRLKSIAQFYLGVFVACAGGAILLFLGPFHEALPVVFSRWLSQALGMILVTPLVVSLSRPRTVIIDRKTVLELILLFTTSIAVGGMVFAGWLPEEIAIIFPALAVLLYAWPALRFNRNITFHITILLAIMALLGTASGRGAFAGLPSEMKLFVLQNYLVLIGLVGLILGELIPEQRSQQKRFEKSQAMLEQREREYVAALEKSRADLLALIENTDYSIWSVDRDLRVVVFNSHFASEFERQWGFPLETGQDPLALLPDDIAASWRELYWRAMAGNGFSTDYPQMAEDGLHYFKVTFHPVRHGEEISGVVVFARDVTDTQYLLDELSASEGRLRGIIESAPFGAHSYEVQSDGNLVFSGYNPAANRILGIDHALLMGKTIEEAFSGLVGTPIPDIYCRVAIDGERYDNEHVAYDEGEIRGAFEVHAFQTAPSHMTVFFRDVTERKKAEVALRQNQAMLAKAQQIAHLGSYETNISTNQLRWSDEVFRIWAYRGDGQPTYEWLLAHVYQEDLPRIIEITQVSRASGEPFSIDYRIVHDDGDVRWLHDMGEVMMDDRGNAVKIFGIVFDITERMRVQEQIRQMNDELESRVRQRTAELEASNRQLDAINRELEAFSYSVSHDLRSPLRAIDGFSHILMDEYASQFPDKAIHWFKAIRSNAKQMGRLIDDLLDFARIGRQPLDLRLVNMDDLAHLALGILESEMASRQVVPDIAHLPDCSGDPNLLLQVWVNLLSNALKFTRSIPIARIEIRAIQNAQEIIYSVRDNGTGFDMQYADKLFGVFQRLQSDEKYEGTGVGLAMVERIVRKHGGRVWAEAQENQGATFYFALPVQSSES